MTNVVGGSGVHHCVQDDESSGCINLLKPSGFFTYRQVKHSEILHGARFALSVLYGS